MSDPQVPTAVVRGKVPEFTRSPDHEPPTGVQLIPTYKLYTANQIGLATFLGGAIGGGWVLARNFRRLRQPGRAWLALIGGIACTGLLVALALSSPQVPRYLFTFVTIAMVGIAKATQGSALAEHARLGGARASWWVTGGIGVASLAIVFGVGVGGVLAVELVTTPPSITLAGGTQIFYADDATEAQARELGAALAKLGYATDHPASIKIRTVLDRRVVAFVVTDKAFDDDEIQTVFHELATPLTKAAFAGAPLDLWLCDDHWEARTILTWDTRPRQLELPNGSDVWFERGASEADGQAVARSLTDNGYFGSPATVHVRHDGRYKVVFFTQPNAADDAATRTRFHRFAVPLSHEAFAGAPVDVWLKDRDGVKAKLAWEARPSAVD